MAWELKLRHDGDEAVGCILHDVLDFFLSVVTGMFYAFAFHTLSCYLHELRILLDFDAPALVVGEVPVHTVHLEESYHVDILLHVFGRHEVAAWVEHDTAVAKTRLVLDANGRSYPSDASGLFWVFDFGREQLHKGLHCIEQALRSLTNGLNAFGSYIEGVAFVVGVERFVDGEHDVAFVSHLDAVACRCADFSSEKFGYCLSLIGSCAHRGATVNNELAFAFHELLWHRDDVNAFVVRLNFAFSACAQ